MESDDGGDYDFVDVEAGVSEMGIFHFLQNRNLYFNILSKLLKRGLNRPLVRDRIVNILQRYRSNKIQGPVPEMLREFEPKPTQQLNDALNFVFTNFLPETVELGFFFECATEIMMIYEELRALEAKIHEDLITIRWHIRCNEEFHIDNPDEAVEFVGRYFLRALPILQSQQRSANNPRRCFDKYRLWAIR